MSGWRPWRSSVIGGVVCCVVASVAPVAVTTAQEPVEKNVVLIELFVTANSKQCEQARQCLEIFANTKNGVAVQVADVTTDRDALKRIWQLSKRVGMEAPRAPTLYLFDRLRVGFKDQATMQRMLDELFTMHVYVRRGCARCRKAKLMLADIQRRWPAIEVRYHDVVYDPGARERFAQATQRYHVTAAATPTFEFAGRLIVGYQDDYLTGSKIEGILRSGLPAAVTTRSSAHRSRPPQRTRPTAAAVTFPSTTLPTARVILGRALSGTTLPGFLTQRLTSGVFHHRDTVATQVTSASQSVVDQEMPPEPEDEWSDAIPLPPAGVEDDFLEEPVSSSDGPQGITVRWFGELRVQDLGMPAFTFLIGLIDGFNPCAMWVLIFLLSILVNIRSRKKIILIAGTFVLISGLAYFAFMAAWLNIFRWVGVQRPVQIVLGGLGIFIGIINIKDFFAFHKGMTLSIPAAARPGIYQRARDIVQAKYLTTAIAGAVVLAVVVNVVELLCTAGLPALYTQILTMQELPAWANYGYLALYNVAYMLDDSILVAIIVITLSHRKLQEQEGRWLKLLSGAVVFSLGWAMVLRPDWLS